MTQAETIPNTTRPSFLSVAATAATTTATPVIADQPDTEIITAGRKFEELFSRYMPAWFEWTRLHREARSETEAKFGDDYSTLRGGNRALAKAQRKNFLTTVLPTTALTRPAMRSNGANRPIYSG